jgi:hypothetical protein
MLLLNHIHQPSSSPYFSCHAVYISQDAKDIDISPNTLPPIFQVPVMASIRGFSRDGTLRAAQLVSAPDAEAVFETLFQDPKTEVLHAHFAAYGCYAFRVIRT